MQVNNKSLLVSSLLFFLNSVTVWKNKSPWKDRKPDWVPDSVTHVHTTCSDMISGTHDLQWHDITITWFLPYFDFVLVWKPVRGVLGLHASLSSRLKKYWTRLSLLSRFLCCEKISQTAALAVCRLCPFLSISALLKSVCCSCCLCVFGGVEEVIGDEFGTI